MRFEFSHVFQAVPQVVAQAMLDPDYPAFLLEHHGVFEEVEPLAQSEQAGRVSRQIRYRPKPVISRVGPKTVPPEWFGFVEHSEWDPQSRTLTFRNEPTTGKLRSLLLNKGAITLREKGTGQTERVATGELKLQLPLFLRPLAAVAERLIHAEAAKLLDAEAAVLAKWLERK